MRTSTSAGERHNAGRRPRTATQRAAVNPCPVSRLTPLTRQAMHIASVPPNAPRSAPVMHSRSEALARGAPAPGQVALGVMIARSRLRYERQAASDRQAATPLRRRDQQGAGHAKWTAGWPAAAARPAGHPRGMNTGRGRSAPERTQPGIGRSAPCKEGPCRHIQERVVSVSGVCRSWEAGDTTRRSRDIQRVIPGNSEPSEGLNPITTR